MAAAADSSKPAAGKRPPPIQEMECPLADESPNSARIASTPTGQELVMAGWDSEVTVVMPASRMRELLREARAGLDRHTRPTVEMPAVTPVTQEGR